MAREDYEIVIGLEVHCELSTKTKIFCSCSTEFGGEPNTHCCPICMAMPGTLPVLNEKVVEYAIKAGLAMNCEITRSGKQDRKNYFYPDLPKAYQISQLDLPLCTNGKLELSTGTVVRINRIHLEEDAGKLIHDPYTGDTLVDLNRCGVPLIEIVSEPDIRSKDEAIEYMQTLKSILEYLEICDCKMQEGSLRCDVNLSVRKKGETKFGTRTETKNLNSFKAIGRAIEFEIDRQIKELENGGQIYQETRRWDDDKGIGYAMRTKEDAHDYRYFPEPDLAPIVLSDDYVNGIEAGLPEMPNVRRERYITELGLPEYDATQITNSKKMAEFFDKAVAKCGNAKLVSNWLMSDVSRKLNEAEMEIDSIKFTAENLGELITLIEKGTISSAIAKKVFETMFETGDAPAKIVEAQGLVQITDESAIRDLVISVINENEQSVQDFINGKDKAVGFIVGQTMKASKGKANPGIVNKLIMEELNKRKNG